MIEEYTSEEIKNRLSNIGEAIGNIALEYITELEQQIEKMKSCGNCKYGFCSWSSASIDKNGRKTVHAWNEEKQAYCDIGNSDDAKYQCWEIKEND